MREDAAGESYAAYFARYLQASRGFSTELVPELEGLANVCDHVLVRRDGVDFTVIAIIDRELNPGTRFASDPREMRLIADACGRYTGTVRGRRRAASILAYEIGAGAVEPQAVERLSHYRRQSREDGYVFAWLLDTAARRAWTNQPLAFLRSRQAAERMLRRPRIDIARRIPPTPIFPEKQPPPVFTVLLIALLFSIFCMELALNLGPLGPLYAPTLRTLVALGGVNRLLVLEAGEWWRLFTGPLLHADLAHVGFNCLGLYLIGRLLEPLIRWRWTAGIFTTSALVGALFSTFLNAPKVTGVGASGGIVGLFAAALIVARRIPPSRQHNRLITMALYGLISTLIPVFIGVVFNSREFLVELGTGSAKLDYSAHLGGAIGGGIMGFVVLKLWPADRATPKWPNAGAALAAAFVAIAGFAIMPIATTYAFVASAPSPNTASAVPAAPRPVVAASYPLETSKLVADLCRHRIVVGRCAWRAGAVGSDPLRQGR